jgi:hypothetical protein
MRWCRAQSNFNCLEKRFTEKCTGNKTFVSFFSKTSLQNIFCSYILSRVYGSMTNNNGLWIGWLDLLTPSLTITSKAHNQWLLKTHSIPYWTTSVFFSIATDLILIYESLNSSTNDLRMTSHLRTNHDDWLLNSLPPQSQLTQSVTCPPFITPGRTEERSPFPTVQVIAYLTVAAKKCVNSVVTLSSVFS